MHWACQTDVETRGIGAGARSYRSKITIPVLTLTGKVVRSAPGSGRACGDPEATKSVDSDGELWEAVQEGFHDESCSLKPCARRHFPTFHGRADVCFSFDGPALLTRCARAQFIVGIWAVDRCMRGVHSNLSGQHGT